MTKSEAKLLGAVDMARAQHAAASTAERTAYAKLTEAKQELRDHYAKVAADHGDDAE